MRTALPLTLSFSLLLPTALLAQDIPNGGFEDWTNTGSYIDPTNWYTSNMVSFYVDSSLTCEQGSPGAVGDHFVKVTDRYLDGMGMQGASISWGLQYLTPGFPYTQRPDAFNGLRQYHPVGIGNDGVVAAVLSRWNPDLGYREVIANAPIHALSPIMNWESFSVPFLYYSDLDPDTANVIIAASQNQTEDGTSIWVDDLSFGDVQSVAERSAPIVSLWPSPANDQLRISADAMLAEVILQDMSGRVLTRTIVNQMQATVRVGELPTGTYLAELRLVDGRRVVRPFVKK